MIIVVTKPTDAQRALVTEAGLADIRAARALLGPAEPSKAGAPRRVRDVFVALAADALKAIEEFDLGSGQ